MFFGTPLKDYENPVTYFCAKHQEWGQTFKGDLDSNPIHQEKFRECVLQSLPQQVRNKLSELVTLNTMPFPEFCEHVGHTVKRYREKKKELEEKDRGLSVLFLSLLFLFPLAAFSFSQFTD